MNKPHVHAEVIKAWADGAEIEYFSSIPKQWRPVIHPSWDPRMLYRVKPQPHKWQKEIDAYAAGKTIQCRWLDENTPVWREIPLKPFFFTDEPDLEYRVKPEPVVKCGNVYDTDEISLHAEERWYHNKNAPRYAGAIKLTFEDEKLVKAEVLK